MGFNYGLEKKRFDKEWEKLRKEYRAAGMDEAAIEAIAFTISSGQTRHYMRGRWQNRIPVLESGSAGGLFSFASGRAIKNHIESLTCIKG